MVICIHTLGAGSMVGRSCFVVSIDEVGILIDMGVHLNPTTAGERVPVVPHDIRLAALFISHYHLDHVGALPFLTLISSDKKLEGVPIYMSEPTRVLAPPLLVDFCKGSPNSEIYYPNQVYASFDSVRTFCIGQRIELDCHPGFYVTPMYAGHVLGGVMFLIEYKDQSVVYTGDYSVSCDSHLRPIDVAPLKLPPCGVDVVISESTHATTVSHRNIADVEQELCGKIDRALSRGGRVLIPIFAVGRTQELASIIRRHLGPKIRLFTTSSAGRRTSILSSFVNTQWTNFEPLAPSLDVLFLGDSEPFPPQSVVFASPAMIEGGASLRLFHEVCEDSKNLVLLTGFCSPDTVGNSVILFASRRTNHRYLNIHGRRVDINCECAYIPFSNHTDSIGIERVIRTLRPKQGVILVHGERPKMETLRTKLLTDVFNDSIRVDIPNNGDILQYKPDEEEGPRITMNAPILTPNITRIVNTPQIPDLEQVLRDCMKTCTITPEINSTSGMNAPNVLCIRDNSRMGVSMRVAAVSDGYSCSWSGLAYMGGEWVTCNPLFAAFRFIVNKTRVAEHDRSSVSSCSD